MAGKFGAPGKPGPTGSVGAGLASLAGVDEEASAAVVADAPSASAFSSEPSAGFVSVSIFFSKERASTASEGTAGKGVLVAGDMPYPACPGHRGNGYSSPLVPSSSGYHSGHFPVVCLPLPTSAFSLFKFFSSVGTRAGTTSVVSSLSLTKLGKISLTFACLNFSWNCRPFFTFLKLMKAKPRFVFPLLDVLRTSAGKVTP
mmetsp:Transcript_111761/g.193719  ORF Transcript_111761/g.193719 Transcript_111761/m.193719 type:complete len:201 (+) Transcript_111761:827-1429(+)